MSSSSRSTIANDNTNNYLFIALDPVSIGTTGEVNVCDESSIVLFKISSQIIWIELVHGR
jgi:hypothetical protein